MDSLWKKGLDLPSFPKLDSDKKTDVLIIGGGICGILCAYMLHQRGVRYILVEAKKICGGITANTTAKITVGHGFIYDKLIREFGIDKARLYLHAQIVASEQYREMCQRIDCHFEEKDSYVYSLDDSKAIDKEIAALKRIGYRAELTASTPLPFEIAGAVKYPAQAQFHPLEFMSAVARDLNIYEETTVERLDGTTALTKHGKIKADKIIVATHFPFINKHGSYFLKMYQHRSYVIALENAQDVEGMYVDEARCGMSFRNYENLLLIGGGSHRTGKQGGGWQELRDFAARYYTSAKEKYAFATQDCMTLDGVPYIGKYSASTEGLFVASGFNKWGMTSSMVAASLLCDLVQGKKNAYEQVFSPSRTMLRPQLAANIGETLKNFIIPTTKRCTHLGCALKWNRYEHSWDCACHGSRFTKEGELINNPAKKGLR